MKRSRTVDSEGDGRPVPGAARLFRWRCVAAFCLTCAAGTGTVLPAWAQTVTNGGPATVKPRTTDTSRDFPAITTRKQWEERALDIREQILVSSGLWPMPEKPPLDAHVFGKIEREGYSIEKVYFQTWPGVYLAGNLYRPLRAGTGRVPAILNPHGHWEHGRLEDTATGSIAARCISFARQGMIAFSYDMAGYNDTRFADSPVTKEFYRDHRHFATNDPANLLYNVTLMGLQTWNSVRALDFLASLPDADTNRLGCTGASGGGTQTFILGAIDDRLAAQAPVVMVSHLMQGGCGCENMPGLRVEYSNVEIAAAAAPRPQIMVAATGDWTRDLPRMEGPAVAGVYRLFDAPEKLRYVQFDFPHNYNQTSREAVYAWFGRWLLGHPDATPVAEAPYQKEPDEALRVWPDAKLPPDALTEQQLIDALKRRASEAWAARIPRDKPGVEDYKKTGLPAWRHTLLVDERRNFLRTAVRPLQGGEGYSFAEVDITRMGEEEKVILLSYTPPKVATNRLGQLKRVVLVSGTGGSEFCDEAFKPAGLATNLLAEGNVVWVVRAFTGTARADQFSGFFTTYNRTLLQERVRDLLAVALQARSSEIGRPVSYQVALCGTGVAGLWATLAAPAADAVAADCNALDATADRGLLEPELFCPGIRNLGGFEGAAMLACPHPLLLHQAGRGFPTAALRKTYDALKESPKLRIEPGRLDDARLTRWISDLN